MICKYFLKNEIDLKFCVFQTTIYKSLFLSKFCVRVTVRSKTMIFKPTTPLDVEKCSLWISNFWVKSFLPFDLYHEKSCKNGEISSRPQLIILLKTRSIFFRKSHNRWKTFAHLLKLKCLIRFGRTFQPGGNITQYRSLLQPQGKWLFVLILRFREVWHDILH